MQVIEIIWVKSLKFKRNPVSQPGYSVPLRGWSLRIQFLFLRHSLAGAQIFSKLLLDPFFLHSFFPTAT